jgi:fucose 4-O-acetylase-like acetyltransferase
MTGADPSTEARLHWMDLLRGIAVLLVISWHAITVSARYGMVMPEFIVLVNTVLSPYRLPMLLIISGMLLPRSLGKPIGVYYEGKARNILWPYIVWTLITALCIDAAVLADPVVWYAGLDHLWFLSTLLVCYGVAPLLRRVPGWLVATALFTIQLAIPPHLPGVDNWIWFGAYFFLGSSLSRLRLTRLPWWLVAVLAVVGVAGAVAAVTGPGTGYAWKLHWIAISLAGVIALIWIAPRIPRGSAVRMFESVGRRSIYYYAAHLAAIGLAVRGLAAVGVSGGWPTYLLLLAVGVGVPFALTRMPGGHWLFAFGRGRDPVRQPN